MIDNDRWLYQINRFLLYFCFACLVSCSEESIPADGTIQGQAYYPIEEGKSWTYTYDSIYYDLSTAKIIEVSGYVKEEIGEALDNNRFTLNRYWKRAESDPWILTDVWTIIKEDSRIIKTEENLPFIKLVFPPRLGKSWDGHAFFPDDTEIVVAGEAIQPYLGWSYQITTVDAVYNEGEINVEQVVTVTQVNEESLLDRRYSIESYAPGIGLVEKEMWILDCQCLGVDPSIPWDEKAEKGFILRQKLIAYQ